MTARTSEGVPVRLPPRFSARVTLRQPYQIDSAIEALHEALFDRAPIPEDLDEADAVEVVGQFGGPIARWAQSLYGVRYHQRQFLFRHQRVSAEEHFDYTPTAGNVDVVIHDGPLQIELEAFLIRVMTSLDTLTTALSALLRVKERNYGPWLEYLKNDKLLAPKVRDQLSSAFADKREWIDRVRQLRNAVAHEGEAPEFKGLSHSGMVVSDAEIGGKPAVAFVVRTWRELLELGHACAKCLPARPMPWKQR